MRRLVDKNNLWVKEMIKAARGGYGGGGDKISAGKDVAV
jgi:hypothetical protein